MGSDRNNSRITNTFILPYHTFAQAPSINGNVRSSLKRTSSNPNSLLLSQLDVDCDAFPIASSSTADGGIKKRKTQGSRPPYSFEKLGTRSTLQMEVDDGKRDVMHFKDTSTLSLDTHSQISEEESELVKEVKRNIQQLRKEYNLWTEEAESEADLFQTIAETPQNATWSCFVPSFEALKSILESANLDNPGNTRVVDRNGFNTDQQLRFLSRQPLDIDALYRGNSRETST